jgi:hypothetical protein
MIAETGDGSIQRYTIEYYKAPVGTDEFSTKTGFSADLNFLLPSLAQFKERYLLAVMSDNSGPKYGLYRMDGEIWLTELRDSGIWSIYRLSKTKLTTLSDLECMMEHYADNTTSLETVTL